MAGRRRLRGPVVGALVALPHRHQRVPRHAAAAASGGPGRWRWARPATADSFDGDPLPEHAWLEPIPDARVLPDDGDPAELAARARPIRLAFVTALQHLPARQRAVLILREVLRWQADRGGRAARHHRRVGQQRAAAGAGHAGARSDLRRHDRSRRVDADQQELLARYVDAFERYDIESLVALLHEDAVMSMPPYSTSGCRAATEMGRCFLGPGIGCEGSRLVATRRQRLRRLRLRTSSTARRLGRRGRIQVIEVSGDRIVGHHNFLDTNLFAAFGLPPTTSTS